MKLKNQIHRIINAVSVILGGLLFLMPPVILAVVIGFTIFYTTTVPSPVSSEMNQQKLMFRALVDLREMK